MDGERKECPIVPDNAVRYFYGEDEDDYLLIAPSHDSINIFPDSKYNHLRYYDGDEEQMRCVFLPAHVLADLHDMGIPHTRRDSITQCEYIAYQEYLGRLAGHTVAVEEVEEPLALPPGDPIDAEVQKAHDSFDQAWNYFRDEPGWQV